MVGSPPNCSRAAVNSNHLPPLYQEGVLPTQPSLPRNWSSPPLRVEIRLTGDVSVGIERTLNSVDAVEAQVVLTWLDDTLERGPEGSDRHTRVT
jgi:hypothetical protein